MSHRGELLLVRRILQLVPLTDPVILGRTGSAKKRSLAGLGVAPGVAVGHIDGSGAVHRRIVARLLEASHALDLIRPGRLGRESAGILGNRQTIGNAARRCLLILGQAQFARRAGNGRQSILKVDGAAPSRTGTEFLERIMGGRLPFLVIPGQVPGVASVDICASPD